MNTEKHIEGFCYCRACDHTAGKHTTPDPNSTGSRCNEPGCKCKKYEHSTAAADQKS